MKKNDKESLVEKAKKNDKESLAAKLEKIAEAVEPIPVIGKLLAAIIRLVAIIVSKPKESLLFISGFALAVVLFNFEIVSTCHKALLSEKIELSKGQGKRIEDFIIELDDLSASNNTASITIHNEKQFEHVFKKRNEGKIFNISGNKYKIFFIEASRDTAKFEIQELE